MAANSKLILILAFTLVSVFANSLIPCSESTPKNGLATQGGAWLQVIISSINVDFDARSFSAEIRALLSLPISVSKIECRIENYIYKNSTLPGGFVGRVDGGQADLTLFPVQETGDYRGNVSAAFRLFGYREFYPFDTYLLNLTITLPSFGLITGDNTGVLTYWGEDYGVGGVGYDVIWEWQMAIIRVHETLSRGIRGSQAASIMPVLAISFLLLGSITLIKPERLEHRLSICLSLFIFSISYSGSMKVPGAGVSLGEAITNNLLAGTGLLAFLSIAQRALIEVKPRLSVIHHLLDGLILIIIAISLTPMGIIGSFATMTKIYPWQANIIVANNILSGFLAFLVLGPYVVKTSIFAIHTIWKRARNKQTAK